MNILTFLLLLPSALSSIFSEPSSSGLIDISGEGEIFYWLFPARTAPDSAPLLVWLSGGPGAASSFAAVAEVGPYRLQENGTLNVLDVSWTNVANVLFIDQPVGVGWSTIASPLYIPFDEFRVGAHLRTFFYEFFSLHPSFSDRPFILSGESFAGHYLPFFGASLIDRPVKGLNLKGVLMGNPFVNPAIQSKSYLPFADAHDLISDANRHKLHVGSKMCTALLQRHMWPFAFAQCQWVMSKILDGRNLYDIRQPCEAPPLCYNFTYIETFFNTPDVKEAMVGGVKQEWSLMRWKVFFWLLTDSVTDAGPAVKQLLEHGIPVTAYHGDQDLICNWMGGLEWMTRLEWKGMDEFRSSPITEWTGVGQRKRGGGLEFVKVEGAGHMVPMDRPDAALAVLEAFLASAVEGRGNADMWEVLHE